MRTGSPAFGKWKAVRLDDKAHRSATPATAWPEDLAPQLSEKDAEAPMLGEAERQASAAMPGGDVKGILFRRTVQHGVQRHGESRVRPPTQHTIAASTEARLEITALTQEIPTVPPRQAHRCAGRCMREFAALWVIFIHDTDRLVVIPSAREKECIGPWLWKRDKHATEPHLSSAPARGVVTPSSVRKVLW